MAVAGSVRASVEPAQPPAVQRLGVQRFGYDEVRVADIAPEVLLPNWQGKPWTSRDYLGHQALIYVIGHQDAPLEELPVAKVPKTDTGPAMAEPNPPITTAPAPAAAVFTSGGIPVSVVWREAIDSLTKVLPQMGKRPVALVLVPPMVLHDQQMLAQTPAYTLLEDEKWTTRTGFGITGTGLTLVAVDRAGFVRRIQTVDQPADLGTAVLGMGTINQDVAVGKPAPDFSLPDFYGHVRRLSELRGQRNLLLSFFPKCFT